MAPEPTYNGINGNPHPTNSFSPASRKNQAVESDHAILEEDRLEPIAVIGLSLEFPEEATTPETFWKMLTEKRCAMTDWPKDRINLDAFYHADGNRTDTISIRGGHFLKEPPGLFDAPFFSISSTEATAMDPQHRRLLETSYRAFENAGLPMEKIFGSRTSVYTGCFTDDYRIMLSKDTDLFLKHSSIGLNVSLLAARLSWFFNLTGPCVNLDSACSSSMMAFDLACQGLRNGDSTMAVVAGANLAYSLELTLHLNNMNFLSPDSRCFSFDDRANGYGRGEGFGVVILKSLSDALKDGDTIRAVIRSAGSNQDGRTPGLTQPSSEAQERLINETYEKAGLSLRSTRYIEAHGTGTAIGDPIEANAIGRAFRKYRSSEEPLYIGAVKSNVGHLEGASGVAGLIKTVLILERGLIPPNANFRKVNQKIDTDSLKIKFPETTVPWPSQGLRRASVSSFGFGGSNSHVVLDDAYHFLRLRGLTGNHCSLEEPLSLENTDTSLRSPQMQAIMSDGSLQKSTVEVQAKATLLMWSAADEGGLARLAEMYNAHFQLLPSLSSNKAGKYLERLAYTLAARRSSLSWRAYATIHSISDLEGLGAKFSKPIRYRSQPKLGYVFTGQGAQHAGMAVELMMYPIFKHSLLRSQMYLYDLGCPWSLLDELAKDSSVSKINDPAFSQPLCTAIQIAIVDLLRTFGIQPATVVGHSSGEIAAAYCVGGLSHRSACKVSYFRGTLAATLASSSQPRGSMMSVGLSETEVNRYLKLLTLQFGYCGVVVGCVNSPTNVTLSGDEIQIDALKLQLEKDQVFARKLQVDVAYHSPHMKKIASDYLQSINDLHCGDHTDNSVMISTVTGRRLYLDEMQQGDYWVKNMTSPVKFSSALAQISSSSAKKVNIKAEAKSQGVPAVNDILEVGPHSALQGPIKDILKALGRRDISYRSVLIRKASAVQTTLDAAGHLRCSGYPVDICQVNRPGKKPGDCPAMLVDLPEYPFDHSRSYWHESRLNKEGYRLRKHPRLDLLGTPVSDWNALEARWRKFIRVSETPWVEDHKVNGTIIYPAAGMIVMALEASRQLADENRKIAGYCIKNATFHHPLVVSQDTQGVEIQLYVRSIKDSSDKDFAWSEFRICIYEDGRWNENCRGTVALEYDEVITEVDAGKEAAALQSRHRQLFDRSRQNCNRNLSAKETYEYLGNRGLEYGPAFQNLQQITCNENGEATAEVKAFKWTANSDDTNHPQQHIIHPATLDAVAQLMMVSLSKGGSEDIPTSILTRIGKIWISSSGISYPTSSVVNTYARASFTGTRKAEASMSCMDQATGSLLLVMEEVETTTVATTTHDPGSENSKVKAKKLCYNLAWKPDLDLMENNSALLAYCEKARPTTRIPPADFYNDLGYVLLMFISTTLEVLTLAERDDLLDCPQPESKSHLHRYIQWMKHQKCRFDAGDLPHLHHSDPKWTLLMEDMEYREALCDRLESSSAQGTLFIKLGRNLPKLLSGELDPLSFMFQDDCIPNHYREVNDDVFCFEPFARYLEAISHKNPALKVLEIGAGIGAVTGDVLGVLAPLSEPLSEEGVEAVEGDHTPKFARYDYTDISPAFFEKAEDTFKSHRARARIAFKALDIEKDPVGQGYEAGSYDLIVAGSVLHATKNLEATLRNVRSLLKIGGKLALYEVTQDQMRSGFAFGLLPGWWLSSEDYRQWSPCVSTNQWHDLLCRTGFSGTDIAIPDFLEPNCHEFSILLATAVERVPALALSPRLGLPQYPDISIILADHSLIQDVTANKVKEHLISKGASICDIVSIPEASATNDLNRRFCIFLNEMEKPFLSNLDAVTFQQLQRIITTAPGILWVTNGGGKLRDEPAFHLIDGLARVCRTEFNKLVFVTLALEKVENVSVSETTVNKIVRVFETSISESVDDFESEYVENDGMLEIGRVSEALYLNREIVARTELKQSKVQRFGACPSLALHIASPGLLDSIQFIEDPLPTQPLAAGELEIKVMATGVNFRDCLTALGQLDTKVLGFECCGIVSRVGSECEFKIGDRVAACTLNTYRTYARAKSQCAIKIPDQISYLEASALPVVFVTAWHALCDLARLQSGETILIHAGAGGTGQAAIQIAKHVGAEIFVTVGSDAKKKLVMDLYEIAEDHIFYSRNTSFAQGIMRMTHDRGVDVILNSLSGKALVASWECIAPFGRFIEIGKRDILGRGNLPMFQFDKNVLFTAIEFGTIINERPFILQRCLQAVLALVAEKKLQVPQPFTVYGVSEIEGAFRHFQSGRNSGKMVIDMRPDELVPTVLDATPKYQFDPNSTYLIAGGLGGLGRSAARWLVDRGARHLILLSRSGARSQVAISFVEELQAKGVHVETPACDVAEADPLSAALARCAVSMPPVRGCIQASMVLRDAVMEKMSFEDWELAIRPKVSGSWNLHKLLPPDLDFFICLSSLVGIIGNGAQANYAAGNAYMDALVHHRIARGQKGTSIDLGWMESEGVVAENEFLQKGISATGYLLPISQSDFHALLDFHCDPTLDLSTSVRGQPLIGLETPRAMRAKGLNEPHWMQRRTFRHLHQMGLDENVGQDSERAVDYVSLFRNATSLGEATRILTEGLVRKLAKALSIPADDIDTSKPLHSYGVDSLLAVELRNYFAKELGAEVAIFDVMGGASFTAVGLTVASRSKYRQASWSTAE